MKLSDDMIRLVLATNGIETPRDAFVTGYHAGMEHAARICDETAAGTAMPQTRIGAENCANSIRILGDETCPD